MTGDAAVGLDAEGYILSVPTGPLLPAYEALVGDACARFYAGLPTLVHSIYVYGSVARGTARMGASDLDLTIVLQQTPNATEAAVLSRLQAELAADHPEVTKVDFDVGTVAEVLAPASALRWGGWLKHYCRHVAGEDLSCRFPKLRPTRALAWALNGDGLPALLAYEQALRASTTAAEALALQRVIARQLLRASMVLRQDEDLAWPHALADLVAMAQKHHPEQAGAWAYFLRQATAPHGDKSDFLVALRAYVCWLQQVLSAPQDDGAA